MKGVILFIIALVPTVFFTVIGMVLSTAYYLIRLKWRSGWQSISQYFYQMALSIDQFANVSLQHIWNRIMIKRKLNFFRFGHEDDTISYCLARNRNRGTLSAFGKFWAWFLDFVDKDHLDKAINNKIEQDKIAALRLNINEYE